MIVSQRYQSFSEFWPFYLGEHAKPTTRAFHFVGTCLGVLILAAAIATRDWRLLPVGLVASYGLAWVSHFFIEHNRPATFTYPWWSFLGDWKMLGLALTGRLGAELRRLDISRVEERRAA